MFGKMKLSTKLYAAFSVLLLALVLMAANSLLSVDDILAANHELTQVAESDRFMLAKEVDHLVWVNTLKDLFVNNLATLTVQTDHTKCGLGKFLYGEGAKSLAAAQPELAPLIKAIKEPHQHLHESASAIKKAWRQNHPGLSLELAARLDDHRRWAANVANALLHGQEITVQEDPKKCAFGKWLHGPEVQGLVAEWPQFASLIKAVMVHHDKLHDSARLIREAADGAEKTRIYETRTMQELDKVAALFGQIAQLESANVQAQANAKKVFVEATLPALDQTKTRLGALTETLVKIQEAKAEAMDETGSRSRLIMLVVAGVGIALGIFLSIFLVRVITKPLNIVIAGLGEGSSQVASASGQVANSSQSLAEGASEQASALEETSASLEEMSSMTKQNADSANQADGLMKDASQVVSKANVSMKDLREAMEKISQASDETAKIIKTIDEVAFQTNLLALNAAVEAARAGEAGAGFAVVADEVRNLAMRSAEAAKNTSDLIEDTLHKVKEGSELVGVTDEAFSQVEESTQKVGELVGEIAAASAEQSQGIDQINTAMSDMDKVTQQVAANAEESAAASEELSAQAGTMQGFVNDLVAMVGGSKKGNGNKSAGGRKLLRGKKDRPEPQPDYPPAGKDHPAGYLTAPKAAPPRQAANRAEGIIPMDDDDFKDF